MTGHDLTDTTPVIPARSSLWSSATAFAARSPEQAALVLMVLALAIRTILAAAIGLSADEAYGIAIARDWSLSYFDHPPLSYWMIHAFVPLLGDGRTIRLPFVLMFTVTTWLIFRLACEQFGARAGLWTVVAVSISGFFILASGWALPDGPLMLCLAAAALCLSRGLAPAPAAARPSPWRTWITAGIWIGLAGLSKYHAAIFVAGLAAFLITTREGRRELLHPAPWVGAGIALLILSPVIVWNAQHHWASIAFQSGRAMNSEILKPGQFFGNIGAQFLYVLPWVLAPMLIAISKTLRSGPSPAALLLLCLGGTIVLFFILVALWAHHNHPHWEMPGWLLLFPLFGDRLAREEAEGRDPRNWALASAILLAVLGALLIVYVDTGIGKTLFVDAASTRDPAIDYIEWTPLRAALSQRGLLDLDRYFLVSADANDMGTIDHALGGGMDIVVLREPRHFAFRSDAGSLVGRDALILGRRDRNPMIAAVLAPWFESIEELPAVQFGRSGMKEIDIPVYIGHRLKRPLPQPAYAERAG